MSKCRPLGWVHAATPGDITRVAAGLKTAALIAPKGNREATGQTDQAIARSSWSTERDCATVLSLIAVEEVLGLYPT